MAVTINGVSPTTAQQREFAAAMGLPVLLQTVTVASAQQDIDFTSLDLDADRIYRIEISMVVGAASVQTVFMYYNSDLTATNYQRQLLAGAGASPQALRAANATALFGNTPSTTNHTLTGQLTLSKAVGKQPTAISSFATMDSADVMFSGNAHQWTGTANITAVKLRHANNFGVGTVAKIYKV